MMNKRIMIFLVLLISCLSWSSTVVGQIKVVSTLTDMQSIARLIGGDKVDVFAIATGFQNPHFVDPKPSYILKLSRADMFVTVGLDLEIGWVPPLLNSARNSKIQKGGEGYVDASMNVPLLQIPTSASRGQGDIHVFGNPHYWLDPVNGKAIAKNIFDGLVRVDPDHRSLFEANLNKFNQTIDAKIKEWTEKMRPYAGTKIIAYHNEWPYFEQRFGLQIVDFLEPKPGIPPSPSQLLKVINEMKRDHIKIIIISPYFTTESADLVARSTGGKVVTLATSVGANDKIQSYIDLFDYNVSQLLDALR
ncbi:MAG: metal ABC transporter substrate-binding protein [Ignavibacteriales bacterium]|nr:metal ABC transporter substrate-binding protein [Ignavibacteriales bacterium]